MHQAKHLTWGEVGCFCVANGAMERIVGRGYIPADPVSKTARIK